MERKSEKEFTTRFKWGMLLAWTPLLLFMSPIIHDVKSQDFFKTHGISAFMMNDFCDGFSILGFAAFMVFEVAAVALLSRSFSRRHEEKLGSGSDGAYCWFGFRLCYWLQPYGIQSTT